MSGCRRASATPRPWRVDPRRRPGMRQAVLLRVSSTCSSSVEPDPAQILVEIKARTDLEALEIGAVRHDAVLPQDEDLIGFFVEHVAFQLAHRCALLPSIHLM